MIRQIVAVIKKSFKLLMLKYNEMSFILDKLTNTLNIYSDEVYNKTIVKIVIYFKNLYFLANFSYSKTYSSGKLRAKF